VVEINFEAIADPARRAWFWHLPTSFNLTPEQVNALLAVGPELLGAAPEFKELLESLGGR
jgi:hypothetical protein